jgi:hypothetical protein
MANIYFTGNLNNMSSVRLLQLNRLIDFCKWNREVFGNVGRSFLFCSPTYPCILVSSWMNLLPHGGSFLSYGLLGIGNYANLTNILSSNMNYDGMPYYLNFNDSVAYFLLYPGYGAEMWQLPNYVNDNNGNSNQGVKYENRTDDIQWCRVENGLHSENNNVYLYGINLNQGSAPNLNRNNATYSHISSAIVYRI